MNHKNISLMLCSLVVAVSCKERSGSSLQSRPGGMNGSESSTWEPSPNQGKYMDCKSEASLKKDFLAQLNHHLVYGDLAKIRSKDKVGADMATYYRESLKKIGVRPNLFESLTEDRLFDGAKGFEFTVRGQKVKVQAGDVLLNLSFGQPSRAGNFYSKRGMIHARLVVGYNAAGELLTFDGGWQGFSRLKQMHSQTIWLRPNPKLLNEKDIQNIVKWAKLLEKSNYDNTLTDDWAEYRSRLNNYLDSGFSQIAAREKALNDAKTGGFAPGNSPDSFLPPSGIYCSEGAAAIFSYLGFRLHGETAFDIIGKFSRQGELPDWAVYADALSGFGADSDQNTFMMHNLFHSYFAFFDSARRNGLISIPGAASSKSMGFSDAMKLNVKAAMADGGQSDLLGRQLDEATTKLGNNIAEKEKVLKLKGALEKIASETGKLAGASDFNITKAVYVVFFKNLAYGPHVFLENSHQFNLIGVFYNTNLTDGYQAKWVADWWVAPFGQPRVSANISTTLYRITPEKSGLPDDRCVTSESAAVLRTY